MFLSFFLQLAQHPPEKFKELEARNICLQNEMQQYRDQVEKVIIFFLSAERCHATSLILYIRVSDPDPWTQKNAEKRKKST